MINKIKQIREATGAGVIDIKKALEEAKGDEEKAIEILRKRGLEKAEKKGDRSVGEGLVASYVHPTGKLAVLVKVYCETDFVAKNEEFKELAKDLAMQIAAMNPLAVNPAEIDSEIVEERRKVWKEELEKEGKKKEMIENILEGKERKFRNENALLTQAFIKNQDKTVEEYIKEKISKIGENIKVGEFVRMEL